MDIENLRTFQSLLQLLTAFNLSYASYDKFNQYINNRIFGLEKENTSLIDDLNIETQNFKAELNNLNDLKERDKNIIASLANFKDSIDKKSSNFFKGFEAVYLLAGLFGIYLMYLLSVINEINFLIDNIIILGGLTFITLLFIIARLFINGYEYTLNPLIIIIIFIFYIGLVSYLINFFSINFEASTFHIHISNLFLISPILINSFGVIIFKRMMRNDLQSIKKLINADTEINKITNRWGWKNKK